MRRLFQPQVRLERAALLLALLSIGGLLLLAHQRGSWTAVAGDESTFLAMAESLATDFDLEFGEADSGRLEAADDRARASVILQRVEGRIFYSKPVLYPLAAAPLVALMGRGGTYLLNAVALAAAFWLFWRSARERSERGTWALTLATFAAAGALLPQVAWSMGDTLQAALALSGTTLALDADRRTRWPPVAAGVLLGLLVAMRLPNGLLAAAVILGVALGGRARRSALLGVGVLAGFALAVLLNLVLVGAANPYRAERATFNRTTGYPVGEQAAAALPQFVDGRATQRLGARPVLQPATTAYSTLYFLVGRHTGLLFYFPAAIVLFGAALRDADRERAALLAGVVGVAVFYLVWLPQNYFGGAAFVGNRYILPAYALLLPALRRPPRIGLLIGVWALSGALFYWSFESVAGERGRPFSSQSHAYAGAFRRLPYESTALSIENRKDRYLSDEFVRFVDRNARIGEFGFHIEKGRPPAEILLAMPRPSGILRFLVRADAAEATIVYRDHGGEQRFTLDPNRGGARGLIEMVAAPAWRKHPFWWTDEAWYAHSFRLEVTAPGDRPVVADVRYLGPYRLVSKFFSYAVTEIELPTVASVGSKTTVSLRLLNDGPRPWASAADVPVHLAHRVTRLGDAAGAWRHTRITERVFEGDELAALVPVTWPSEPGSFELEIDLVVAGIELFQGWLGEPVAKGPVEVTLDPGAVEGVVTSR